MIASAKIERSDGEVFNIDGNPWTLEADGLENIANLDYTVSTSPNVLTDGSTLVDKRVEEVDRTFKAVCLHSYNQGTERLNAIAFFNPRYSFKVHLTYRGNTRWCEGELYGFEAPTDVERNNATLTFTILCLDPFWRDENIHDESMTDATGMFTFPFICLQPSREKPSGCVTSFRIYDGLNTIYNTGGIDAPFKIDASFNASITNPTFHINDKFVKVIYPFVSGDNLVIDFMAAPPKVTLNGENSINRCTRDSVFVGMVLNVGSNLFWYEAEVGDINTMDVSITHYDRYMGV